MAGAASGEGLGNKFLAHIREVDAITHVVRCFENADVIHVNNKVDPISDIETIDTELALADLESVEKALQRAERSAKTGDKDAKARAEVLGRVRAGLDAGKPARALGLSDEDKAQVRDLFLLTLKPVMYVANVLEDGFENNPHLDAVRARAVGEGAEVVPVSAAIEEELSQLDDADRDTFLHDLGLDEPGLNRVIRAAYKLLGLQTYFTAGVKEVRAWTVQGRLDRAAGRRGDPHRLREGLHPRRNHRLRRLHQVPGRVRRPRRRPPAPGRQGIPGAGRRRPALPLQRLSRRPPACVRR